MSSDVLIRAEKVGMRFAAGHEALRDVDLNVHGGEFVSLVGPSGCGKSTLLRMAAGLVQPTSGQLTLGGMPPIQARPAEHRIGFVFQDPTLLPWRNVLGNIRLPLELQGVSAEQGQSLVRESLQLIGLSESDGHKYPRMLSGGMRMRVSLARALVTQPKVMLLDEPFAALDDILRQQLNEELLSIWAGETGSNSQQTGSRSWTAMFVTHNVAEAVFLSQRVLVMSATPGRIVEDIPVPFEYPRTAELRAEADFAALAGEVSRHLRGAAV